MLIKSFLHFLKFSMVNVNVQGWCSPFGRTCTAVRIVPTKTCAGLKTSQKKYLIPAHISGYLWKILRETFWK